MDYFKHPYLSNSKLTDFGQELGVIDSFSTTEEQTLENFRFGTLFDFYETEPDKFDYLNQRLIGTDYTFDKNDITKVKRMSKSLRSNKRYQLILGLNPNFQKEIYNDNFTLDGVNYVGFKAKLDLYVPGLVVDLKTTKCTSQAQFENTCDMFGYYRQMLLYMKLTGANKSLIVGVSKVNHKVFNVNFSVDHPKYQETLDMCKMLIFKWKFLKL